MTEKVFIKNRRDQKIAVLVDEVEGAKGLAFVMHGLGGFKEQDFMKTYVEAFVEKDYTVVRFDFANSIGESDGEMGDARVGTCYHDLEDVIVWAKKQDWYKAPFVLAGHSLGAFCATLYAEQHSERIRALAPTSALISGKFEAEQNSQEMMEKWKRGGVIKMESNSRPGTIKHISWEYEEDLMQRDLLPEVDKLIMPVLMLVGEHDKGTPLKHQQILYDQLPGKKELHVIKDAGHTFRKAKHLKNIKRIFLNWLDKIDHAK